MKYLITFRHGESYKNLRKINGGNGDNLTPQGVFQVEKACSYLASFIKKHPDKKVYVFQSCSRVQLTETAKILEKHIGVQSQIDPRYAPIKLGVFNGLSEQRKRELYPDACRELDEWTAGTRDIMDVHVEGMQDANEQVNNMIHLINRVPDDSIVIFIGTRSDISAVKNIKLGNHPSIKYSYWFHPTEFAELDCHKFISSPKTMPKFKPEFKIIGDNIQFADKSDNDLDKGENEDE